MSKQSDIVKVSQGAAGDPLFVDATNNRVGVGTSSPAANLDVTGTIKLDGNYPVGTGNVALGDAALDSNVSGNYNTAIGADALTANTTGNYNTAVGYQAAYNSTAGDVTAVGAYALFNQTTQNADTAVGKYAGYNHNGGYYLTAVGQQAAYSNTTGASNTAIGVSALHSNTTASNNTAVGYQAGYSNTTSAGNVFLGYYAGNASTGASNTYVGSGSGYLMTTGARNTILGQFSGNQGGLDIRTSNNNIVLSDGDGNPRLQVSQYGEIAAKGDQSTSSVFDTNFSGGNGRRALLWHQGGSSTGRPRMTLESHTNAGVLQLNCTFDDSASRTIATFFRRGTECGTITGTASSTSYNTSSDYRLKENVVDLTGATTRLKQLSPKRFNFIADANTTVDGFLAHEVQSIVPEAITGAYNEVETWGEEDDLPDGVSLGDNKLDENGNTIPKYQGIDQSKLVPLLTAALQEALTEIAALKTRVTALEGN